MSSGDKESAPAHGNSPSSLGGDRKYCKISSTIKDRFLKFSWRQIWLTCLNSEIPEISNSFQLENFRVNRIFEPKKCDPNEKNNYFQTTWNQFTFLGGYGSGRRLLVVLVWGSFLVKNTQRMYYVRFKHDLKGGESGKACHGACDTGWGRALANWWHGVGWGGSVTVTRAVCRFRVWCALPHLGVWETCKKSIHLRNWIVF